MNKTNTRQNVPYSVTYLHTENTKETTCVFNFDVKALIQTNKKEMGHVYLLVMRLSESLNYELPYVSDKKCTKPIEKFLLLCNDFVYLR